VRVAIVAMEKNGVFYGFPILSIFEFESACI
jgi:hypothetical protein